MSKTKAILYLICESPLHAGVGSDIGIVDNPIQRERHTLWPKVESSSLKGALRQHFYLHNKVSQQDLFRIFGPENGDEHAGSLKIADAAIVLFPVKSMKGTFTWITCPAALQRMATIYSLAHDKDLKIEGMPDKMDEDSVIVNKNKASLTINTGNESYVVLEEYAFNITDSESKIEGKDAGQWFADHVFLNSGEFWKNKIVNDLCIVHDDVFEDYVNMSTEVITRIKIEADKGTVKDGALFTEEFLPVDSVLYAFTEVQCAFKKKGDTHLGKPDEVFNKVTEVLCDTNVFQLGGNASLGKGIMKPVLLTANEND